MDDNLFGFKKVYAIRLPDGRILGQSEDYPFLWTNRQGAEECLERTRKNAAFMGVPDWQGEIVYQLCSPFLGDNDNAQPFIAELEAWLANQTGGDTK